LGEVRSYEVEDFGHPSLRGLRFPPDSELFGSLEARPTTVLETSRPLVSIVPKRQQGEVGAEVLLAEPMNVAFDGPRGRLYLVEVPSRELVELWQGPEGRIETVRLSASELGLGEAAGITVGWGGESLFGLDRAGGQIVHLDLRSDLEGSGPVHLGEHGVSTIPLEAQGLGELGGLAYDPGSGRFLVLSTSLETLYEFSDRGRWVKSHDLSELGLEGPVRLLVAPSADLTDDPSVLHLYLIDGGPEGELLESRIQEFSLSAPARLPAPAVAMETASLVQVIDSSVFGSPSAEITGIAYLPSLDSLLVSGSELNEMQIFPGENVFEVGLFGSLLSSGTTSGYSDEPTGVGFDPGVNASGGVGTVFFTDDRGAGSFQMVDLGLDGLYGTGDDVWGSISTVVFGAGNPEGITFDRTEGVLFLVDGVNSEVYRIAPGQNGRFDGVPSEGGDDEVRSFDTASLGVTEPEGIAYDQTTGNLYVVGKPVELVIEVTRSGVLVRTLDISAAGAFQPVGLAFGRSSEDPLAWSLYVADGGIDAGSGSEESGSRVYEMAAPNTRPVANPDSATTDEGVAVTIDVSANDTDVDGNLDPTTTNTSCRTCSVPANGTLVNNGDGTFTYTPNPGFGGTDGFVYEICDTAGKCDTAPVSIQVGNPPVANDDSVSTPEETLVTIDVAANDGDADGNLDPTSANVTCANGSIGCSVPANGMLVNNGDGTFDLLGSCERHVGEQR
jgi:hypothetical protein